jgi:hypothetical protein
VPLEFRRSGWVSDYDEVVVLARRTVRKVLASRAQDIPVDLWDVGGSGVGAQAFEARCGAAFRLGGRSWGSPSCQAGRSPLPTWRMWKRSSRLGRESEIKSGLLAFGAVDGTGLRKAFQNSRSLSSGCGRTEQCRMEQPQAFRAELQRARRWERRWDP